MTEYITVYDISEENMKLTWLMPFGLIILFGFLAFSDYQKSRVDFKSRIRFFIMTTVFLIVWASIVGHHQITSYYQVQDLLEENNLKLVEGTIKEFDPMPYGGHKNESFLVNNIKFEYSDFNEEFYGFNNTKSHGGPIIGNDQKVRIKYFPRYDKNYIFKLEIEKP